MKFFLALFFLLLIFLGCGKTKTAVENVPPFDVQYQHGAKLSIQYVPDNDETSVYQEELKSMPVVSVNGKALSERHVFEFNNSDIYSGKTPQFVEKNAVLQITHSISGKNLWHFPAKANFIVIADGEKIEVPVSSQSKLDKNDPADKEFYEFLIMQPNYPLYSKIAGAKAVKMQIGNASFNLSEVEIAAFGDYISLLPNK